MNEKKFYWNSFEAMNKARNYAIKYVYDEWAP